MSGADPARVEGWKNWQLNVPKQGCTWVPQGRKSLLVVIPFPLLFTLVCWRLDEVGDSSPDGDVIEGLTVIAEGHINHNTWLGHHRGGEQLALAVPTLMSLLPSDWECKYEQDFMPDRDHKSQAFIQASHCWLSIFKVPINWAFFAYVCLFLGNYVT